MIFSHKCLLVSYSVLVKCHSLDCFPVRKGAFALGIEVLQTKVHQKGSQEIKLPLQILSGSLGLNSFSTQSALGEGIDLGWGFGGNI